MESFIGSSDLIGYIAAKCRQKGTVCLTVPVPIDVQDASWYLLHYREDLKGQMSNIVVESQVFMSHSG